MAERVSWAVSHSPGVVTTTDARHVLGSVMAPAATAVGKRTGRLPKLSMDAFNVTATGTPDGFVHVAPGHLWVMGTRSIAPYVQTLDAIKDINILATPAHATLTRWDLIIAQQNDELHGDADNTWTVKQVVGTPSGSPVDPTVTGSPDYTLLARVVVGPAAISITNGVITQLLTAHTVALGGVVPVLNQTERDAITGVYDGLLCWRRDRDWLEGYDGAAWKVQGVAICSSTADRDSAITSPTNGQIATTTDTNTQWLRAGGSWVEYPNQPRANMRHSVSQSIPNAVFTSLAFNSEDFDSANGHDTVTNNSRYTCQKAGTYLLSGAVGWLANATGFRANSWAKNGTTLSGSQKSDQALTFAAEFQQSARTIQVQLAVNDYIELQAYQESGGGALSTTATSNVFSNMSILRTGA